MGGEKATLADQLRGDENCRHPAGGREFARPSPLRGE
jgi:hypothetical protein